MRFIHFSDVHVREPNPGWRLSDVLSKRAVGWINLAGFRRGRSFQHAGPRISLLIKTVKQMQPDAVVFSGDASTLGFTAEIRRVATLLDVHGPIPGIAVPGNHDHYTRDAQRSGAFDEAFAPWLVGRRVDDAIYPFAREVHGVWFIGVNSSVPNRLVWDSRGEVGDAQLRRLDRLLADVPAGPRVLVTHYPYCTAEGRAEPVWHGLRDREALAAMARRHGVNLWLSGHRHRPYLLPPSPETPFAVACVGSATQENLASFAEMTIEESQLSVRRFYFDVMKNAYEVRDDPVINFGIGFQS